MATINWKNAPTPEETAQAALAVAERELTAAVQGYMDTIARARGYDSILSLCSYATSSNPLFAAEGQAGVNFRDGCWGVSHRIADDVRAGQRPIPTQQGVLDELPVMQWPE